MNALKTKVLFVSSLLVITSNSQDPEKYPARPYFEFYEKGKEIKRVEEYNNQKDSETSKQYLLSFSQENYEKLSIYLVDSTETYGRSVSINSIELYKVYDKKDPVFNQYVAFFQRSFPENPRRFPDRNNKAKVLVFDGKEKSKVIYIHGFQGPEFSILEGVTGKISAGDTYKTSNGAMSASPPFDHLTKLWALKLNE